MAIRSVLKSEILEHIIDSGVVGQEEICYFHDTIIGRLIVAQSLEDNKGGLIHIAEGVHCEASDLTQGLVKSLANPNNLHRELLPWFGVKLPVHLPNGEPASLTLSHLPDEMVIKLIRRNESFD